MTHEFFMMMEPPRITQQEHKMAVSKRTGKPIVYEPAELKAARAKLTAACAEHKPIRKMEGPLLLLTKWCYPDKAGMHEDGEYKITKPDTDNVVKMLKDVMTKCGYWHDDAQVASDHIEKFWVRSRPGIYVKIVEIGKEY